MIKLKEIIYLITQITLTTSITTITTTTITITLTLTVINKNFSNYIIKTNFSNPNSHTNLNKSSNYQIYYNLNQTLYKIINNKNNDILKKNKMKLIKYTNNYKNRKTIK